MEELPGNSAAGIPAPGVKRGGKRARSPPRRRLPSSRAASKAERDARKRQNPGENPLFYKCTFLWSRRKLAKIRHQGSLDICGPITSTCVSGAGRAVTEGEDYEEWSPQEITDHADKGEIGADGKRLPIKDPDKFKGIYMEDALEYIQDHGVALESNYEFVGQKRKDRHTFQIKGPKLFIGGYNCISEDFVVEDDPDSGLTKEQINYRNVCQRIEEWPLAASLWSTSDLQKHTGERVYGVPGTSSSNPSGVEPRLHFVPVVGYGTDGEVGDFYAIQNSYGTSFGKDGIGLVHPSQLLEFFTVDSPFRVV